MHFLKKLLLKEEPTLKPLVHLLYTKVKNLFIKPRERILLSWRLKYTVLLISLKKYGAEPAPNDGKKWLNKFNIIIKTMRKKYILYSKWNKSASDYAFLQKL